MSKTLFYYDAKFHEDYYKDLPIDYTKSTDWDPEARELLDGILAFLASCKEVYNTDHKKIDRDSFINWLEVKAYHAPLTFVMEVKDEVCNDFVYVTTESPEFMELTPDLIDLAITETKDELNKVAGLFEDEFMKKIFTDMRNEGLFTAMAVRGKEGAESLLKDYIVAKVSTIVPKESIEKFANEFFSLMGEISDEEIKEAADELHSLIDGIPDEEIKEVVEAEDKSTAVNELSERLKSLKRADRTPIEANLESPVKVNVIDRVVPSAKVDVQTVPAVQSIVKEDSPVKDEELEPWEKELKKKALTFRHYCEHAGLKLQKIVLNKSGLIYSSISNGTITRDVILDFDSKTYGPFDKWYMASPEPGFELSYPPLKCKPENIRAVFDGILAGKTWEDLQEHLAVPLVVAKNIGIINYSSMNKLNPKIKDYILDKIFTVVYTNKEAVKHFSGRRFNIYLISEDGKSFKLVSHNKIPQYLNGPNLNNPDMVTITVDGDDVSVKVSPIKKKGSK